jgi:hypothetical protein
MALTNVDGFTMSNAGARVAGSGVWWTDYDTVDAASGLTLNLNTLAPGTHVLTYELMYETGLYVTRDYTVTVVSEADAIADALAVVKPGIILNNGEFTDLSVNLPLTTDIDGMTFTWAVDAASSGVAHVNNASGILTLDRMYTSQKVILTASILAEDAGGTPQLKDTESFEFRIVPETVAGIEARIAEVIKNATYATKFLDGTVDGADADFATTLNASLFSSELDTPTIVWSYEVVTANSTLTTSGLTINSGTGELTVTSGFVPATPTTIKVIATLTVDSNPDIAAKDDVIVTKEFELVIFKN